jgi:hypothetical protein
LAHLLETGESREPVFDPLVEAPPRNGWSSDDDCEGSPTAVKDYIFPVSEGRGAGPEM